MEYLANEIMSFITLNPIFRERIICGGKTKFDEELIAQLMECRNERGVAIRGISYYEKIRTCTVHDIRDESENHICILYNDKIEINIIKQPFIGGMIRFTDNDHRFEPKVQDHADNFYAYMMEEHDCPVDLDDGYWRDEDVLLKWEHNHFMDMRYEYGFIMPRIANPQFFWEYTLTGPAQVYREALDIIHHYDL